MELGEQLDVERERQHRPSALRKHCAGDVIWFCAKDVALGHRFPHHALDAPEQFLVLELLVAEAHKRFQSYLIARRVIATELEDFGIDVAFDKPEHIRVSAPLYLA